MSDTNGKQNHFHFNKYERNAIVGEMVYYYPSASRQEVPSLAVVVSSAGLCVGVRVFAGARFRQYSAVRHINDPHWDGKAGKVSKLNGSGAWDFHECYGEIITNQLKKNARVHERLARLKEQQSSMPPAEYEALVALEQHGPVMDRIVKDTGMTVAELTNLPQFDEKFKQARLERWEEKQAKSVASKKGLEKKRAAKEAAKSEAKDESKEPAEASA